MKKEAGFFYFREIFGIVLSVFTIAAVTPITVFMYIDNPTILADLDTSCSLKGSFALFCLAFVIEVFLGILRGSCFAMVFLCRGHCRINCYHVIVLLHFTSCVFLFIGITVFSVKLNANIWYWNMATLSAFFAMINSFITCIFQREYRSIRREKSIFKKLGRKIGALQNEALLLKEEDSLKLMKK